MIFFKKQLNADATENAGGAPEATDNSTATTNAPVEENSPSIEEPVAVVEEPAAAVEETVAVVEEPVAAVEETIADVEETAEPVKAVEPVAEVIVTAHDDFDWNVDKRNVSVYNKEDREKYDKVYDDTFKLITDNTMVTGIVVGLTKTDVVVNIGFKSDGLISLNEFRDTTIAIGDEVEIMVVEKEDRNGHLNLSRKQARVTRAWKKLWKPTKPAKWLPVWLPAKPRAA